ncbi:hypothetical protein DH2020_005839 [Rehmannia glutinosa]|uniref:Uncharacterized protein n=1 Tax=Rehmannia glutinosa TaxID=99300 RepID=A0ABR0XHB8_REHGL
MDFLCKPLNQETSDCSLSEQDIRKCPFLRNIDKPTNFSFGSLNFPIPSSKGARGPIFEDGPNFEFAFKIFHGKDGVVPLTENSQLCLDKQETEAIPEFNPLASRAASISMSAFGPGGPFGFNSFFGKMQNKKSESSRKKEHSPKGDSSKHEALGNEWLKTGNCPIAKSYRAVSHVLPLVATALRPPPGIKLKCPPAVVAARAALARTAFVKSVLHAAVPFIAMLRKSVVMPKTAMALTIAGSILGQIIGSRAERLRLKAKAERANLVAQAPPADGVTGGGQCGKEGIAWDPLSDKIEKTSSSPASVCF